MLCCDWIRWAPQVDLVHNQKWGEDCDMMADASQQAESVECYLQKAHIRLRMMAWTQPAAHIKLQGHFARALKVRDRYARYVLERGFIPEGVAESPGSGEHRDFSPHQAFWLGLVLKLKQSGLKTPLAVQVADYADGAVRTGADARVGLPVLPEGGGDLRPNTSTSSKLVTFSTSAW